LRKPNIADEFSVKLIATLKRLLPFDCDRLMGLLQGDALESLRCDLIDEVIEGKIRTPRHIIFEGEYFLCDRTSGVLWVCCLMKGKIKYYVRDIMPLLKDCGKQLSVYNGYFYIPEGLYK
jgi:hypothetical protein